MRKLFKERKLFKGGNYMRKYGISIFWKDDNFLNHDLPVFRVAPAEAKN